MPRLTLALIALALPASAEDVKKINVLSLGGAFSESQVVAYNRPFTETTGISVVMSDSDNPAQPIKAQVDAGNVTFDVAAVDSSDAVRLCDEGVIEPINHARLLPAPDGTPAADDFLPGGLQECFVATDVYATAIAYNVDRIGDEAPAKISDFFDLEKFPGRRAVLRQPRFTLELALMGDGVPADQVYKVLATPEGVDRAFAKLDSIKDQIVWWDAGAQPPQLLADAEVAMAQTYTGRIFTSVIEDGMPFRILWDGQVYTTEGWVIPKGAPNPGVALDYVIFSTSTEAQARAAQHISYGPARRSSESLVGLYKDGKTDMGPWLPTSPENMGHALAYGTDFWADHDTELTERFNAWLPGKGGQ